VPERADTYEGISGSEEEEDGDDVERQTSHTSDGRSKQYEGVPEIRKQMKWLFPAMGIGVCRLQKTIEVYTEQFAGPPCSRRPDDNCIELWAYRFRATCFE